MPSPSSLTTRLAFTPQTVKGTYPTTNVQATRAISLESVPEMEYVENENHMLGVHERSTAAQSVPERSSTSVPLDFEVGAYPYSMAHLLFGIGMVQGAPVVATGVTTHKFVKSTVSDAPYITSYIRMGTGAGKFSRQIHDCRLSQLVLSLQRGQGVQARGVGMGLKETIIADGGYTVKAEADTEFMPFLGGMIWDTATAGFSDFDFGIPREHTITIDRAIEMDDQLLHTFWRNDNQEMSFAVRGEIRGLELSLAFYNELLYGGVGVVTGASLSAATVLTGLTIEMNTNRPIPSTTTPFKFIINIPKAEIRIGRFQAQNNQIIRADAAWKMIDDALTPPIRIELANDIASYPISTAGFTAAGGSAWTLPDATP